MSTNGEQDHNEAELMYIICAHCRTWVDIKPGPLNLISHGICKSCYDEVERQLEESDRDL